MTHQVAAPSESRQAYPSVVTPTARCLRADAVTEWQALLVLPASGGTGYQGHGLILPANAVWACQHMHPDWRSALECARTQLAAGEP